MKAPMPYRENSSGTIYICTTHQWRISTEMICIMWWLKGKQHELVAMSTLSPIGLHSSNGMRMCVCVCVCARVYRMNMRVCTTLAHPHISSFRIMPVLYAHTPTSSNHSRTANWQGEKWILLNRHGCKWIWWTFVSPAFAHAWFCCRTLSLAVRDTLTS